jgi:predicted Zn-dependent protease
MIGDGHPIISRRALLRLSAALPFAGAASLLQAKEPQITVPSFNTLTDEEEIAFGRKAAAEFDAKLPLLGIRALDEYVNSMVAKLGRASQRPNMDYQAKVVNTADVNAFSILGGHMYVYRGLLHFIQSEAELAAVLGHEVGHVVGHHSANKIMLNVRARQLYELVKKNVRLQNDVIRQVIEKLGGPLAILAMMKYEREAEFQADMLGFYEMVRCTWNPDGFVEFFDRIRKMSGDPDAFRRLLSDHPQPADRAARIRQEMSAVRMPARLTETSLSFKAMKLGLSALPPIPAKK